MKKTNIHLRFGAITLLILIAAFSRLIPHPPNVAPLSAMALFGAAYFSKKHFAFIIPLIAMWISDLAINNIIYGHYFEQFVWFYPGFYWTYLAFVFIALLGIVALKNLKLQILIPVSLLASIIFFLVSNFGVWKSGIMYPNTLEGLMACYTAGIPFLKNTVLGDLLYCGVLFGVFELSTFRFPTLKAEPVKKIKIINSKTHEKNLP